MSEVEIGEQELANMLTDSVTRLNQLLLDAARLGLRVDLDVDTDWFNGFTRVHQLKLSAYKAL
jgi:hypothetical protein